MLAGYFVEQSRRKLGLQQLKIAKDVLPYLNAYHWPGNVRELEHVISRAALKASVNTQSPIVIINPIDCGELVRELTIEGTSSDEPKTNPIQTQQFLLKPDESLKQATERFQSEMIRNTLSIHNGNWSAAARELNTDRANLTRLAKRLGINVTKQIS